MSAAATPVPAVTRDQLQALSTGADSYAFLRVALPALEHDADADLALRAIRHYVMLGLFEPALELADRLPAEAAAALEHVGTPGRLRAAPPSRRSWAAYQSRFCANLAAAVEIRPELRTLETAWQRGRDALELYECRDGNFQIATRDCRGRIVWLPALMDHRGLSQSATIPRDPAEPFVQPYVLEGIGLGWLLERLWQETRHVYLNYSPPLYVLEPNPLAAAAALHLHEWRELLRDPRAFLLIGDDCAEQFESLLRRREDLALPAYQIRMVRRGPELRRSLDEIVEHIAGERNRQTEALQSERSRRGRARDGQYWAERLGRPEAGRPLRVLFAVSRHTTYLQYAVRDLAQAFKRRGCRTLTLTEGDDFSIVPATTYLRAARDFKPDLYLLIDHHRRESPQCFAPDVPFVCWIQDVLPHLHCSEAGRSLGALDFFIAPSVAELVHRYGYPDRNGLTWPACTDAHVYSAGRLSPAELARYVCDVSYVSNQSRTPEALRDERRRLFEGDPAGVRLADWLFDALLRLFSERPDVAVAYAPYLIHDAREAIGIPVLPPLLEDALLKRYLIPLAELLFRQSTLEIVAACCERRGLTLHLYGAGWEGHPRFARHARGVAQNGGELQAIYQASRVNLQIVGSGAVHQRLLDGLAAGGFFLIRRTPSDEAHRPMQQFLDAWRRCTAAPGREYTAAEQPELARAVEAEWAQRGRHRPCDRFTLSQSALDSFAEHEADGFRQFADAVFPEYGRVAFDTGPEFDALLDRYLDNEGERSMVAGAMRRAVLERFTYDALVSRLLEFLVDRLASGSARQGRASVACV
jgi:hypothetical protein